MSFKDKPLKKIVSDNRVTIDVIHENKLQSFSKNNESHEMCLQEINDLEEEYKHNPSETLITKIDALREKADRYNSDEELDYHLDTAIILSEYYSKKNGEIQEPRQEVSVVDFMKKKIQKPVSNTLTETYMSKVDGIVSNSKVSDLHICPNCSGVLSMRNLDSILLCEICGFTKDIIINSEKASYKDPPRESSYFAYKRINHFNEWLAQFQAKETTDIPEEVYQGIIQELKKNPFITTDNVSYKNIREILKKLKFNKYYEHIPHIINILNGEKAPLLTREYEEQLRMMFKEIQTPFIKHCPPDRKNFLSYSYVLHKFCELLELDELLIYFPLLKSREKLQQQDVIWMKICKSLNWEYIPSI